jgi:hypothetical protein
METQCITVTASQLNRSAVEEIEFDHSHISGGLSKIMTADNVIGIFTSRAMRERGRYQIQFMKTRSSSGVGQKVDLDFNVETLRITDLGDEGDVGSNGGNRPGNSSQSSVYAGLKRTSTVSTDPETGEIDPRQGLNAPKIRAEVGGASIRKMLANLNSERD